MEASSSSIDCALRNVKKVFEHEQEKLFDIIDSLQKNVVKLKNDLNSSQKEKTLLQNEITILNEGLTEGKKEYQKCVTAIKEKNKKILLLTKKIELFEASNQNECPTCLTKQKPKKINSRHILFQSPVKKTDLPAFLVPMTEQYPEEAKSCSTPFTVAETENVFNHPTEVGSDDETTWPESPSILSHQEYSAPAPCSEVINELFKKPVETPNRGQRNCIDSMETSKDLFSDNSVSKNSENVRANLSAMLMPNKQGQIPSLNDDSWMIDDIGDANEPSKKSKVSQSNSKSSKDLEDSWLDDTIMKKKPSTINYKFSEVVRKKADREKLNGYDCKECRKYYSSDNLSETQLNEKLKGCSKHRHASTPPPDTPESFWDIDFPDTQECIKRGYMLTENDELPEHAKPKFNRDQSRKRIKFQ